VILPLALTCPTVRIFPPDTLAVTLTPVPVKLVVDILQPPFNLNTQEQQQLKDQIDFLYNNHQIVKLSGLKKAVNSISGWFKKKVSLS